MEILKKLNDKQKILIILSLIVILGLVLRLSLLGTESVWLDESISIFVAEKSFSGIVSYSDPTPPLFYLILHMFLKIVPYTSSLVFLLTIVFSLGVIILAYFVTKELFDKRSALLSAFLVTISPIQIYYANELRVYSLFFLLTLFSMFFFVRLIKKYSVKDIILFTLFSIMMLYSHSYSVFIIFVQGIYIFFNWKKIKKPFHLFSALGFSFLTFIPWIYSSLFGKAIDNFSWIAKPTFPELFSVLRRSFGGTFLSVPSILITVICSLLFLYFIFLYTKKTNFEKKYLSRFNLRKRIKSNSNLSNSDKFSIISLWFIALTFIPFIVSFIFFPLFIARYALAVSIPLFIAIGHTLTKIPNVLKNVLLILIILCSLFGVLIDYQTPTKERWGEVAFDLDAYKPAGGVSVIVSFFQALPLLYQVNPSCLLLENDAYVYSCGWNRARIHAPSEIKNLDHIFESKEFLLILSYEQYNGGLELVDEINNSYNLSFIKSYPIFVYEGFFDPIVFDEREVEYTNPIRLYDAKKYSSSIIK